MSDVDLPAAHLRRQVAGAVDVVVHLARLRDGRRVVWEIATVEGLSEGEYDVETLFRYRVAPGERGVHVVTGHIPSLVGRVRDRGEAVPDECFERGLDR